MEKIVELIENVWSMDSGRPGPVLAIIGGTHGNEETGCNVVLHLYEEIHQGSLALTQGKLILGLGNPKAIVKRERGSEEGADLNRCFTPDILTGSSSSYEHQRARALAIALREVTIGIDLHATNKPSMPFAFSQTEPGITAKALISCLQASIVLTDPHWIFAGGPITLDEFFFQHGGVGLCYETGLAEDTSRTKEVLNEMLNCMRLLGIMKGNPTILDRSQSVYELTSSIILSETGFTYAEDTGGYNFQPVQSGQIIGWHGSVSHVAKHEGVIVFPKLTSLWRVGNPVGYLAKKI